ncbi:MAG TPA: PaaI family thioesterase [Deltaproteobacteria bacterium]|nr:PaaI family thioesterase [Deltaproteobacteria bacterium]
MTQEVPDFEALSDAVAQVRRLIAHLRKTTAPPELIRGVEAGVEALNERLAGFDHPGPYAQRSLVMSLSDHTRTTDVPAEYFPYSPVIGPLNAIAPPVEFRFDGEEIHAEHVFDAPYNGPPTAVHGGIIALVFDELLGALGALRDIGGFTGTLTIRYVSLTPIGLPIRMRSWIDRREGRKAFIRGTMHHGEQLCAEAEGIFIRPKGSMLEHALATEAPDGKTTPADG